MSSTSPSDGVPEHNHHPSPQPRLPWNHPRVTLVGILEQALKHLIKELCPDEPKSILKKARDLLRNLPHWQRAVTAQIAAEGSFNVSEERAWCLEVIQVAETTVVKLGSLEARGVEKDGQANVEWEVLTDAVRVAVKTLTSTKKSESKIADSSTESTDITVQQREPA